MKMVWTNNINLKNNKKQVFVPFSDFYEKKKKEIIEWILLHNPMALHAWLLYNFKFTLRLK